MPESHYPPKKRNHWVPSTHHGEVGLDLYTLKWTVIPGTMEHRVPPWACQDFPVTRIAELKSHFKHLSSQTISLVWGDSIKDQKVQQKRSFSVFITLRQCMISSNKGRYDMLLLQPVGWHSGLECWLSGVLTNTL